MGKLRLLALITLLIIFVNQSFAQFKITTRQDGDDVVFDAEINEYGTHTVILEFTDLKGYKDTFGGEKKAIVSYPRTNSIFRLRKDGNGASSYRYSYRLWLGRYNAKPDKDYPYLLPVKDGKSLRTAKLSNINYELKKNDTDSILGIVLNSNEMDTIYAMRSGHVISVADKERDLKKVEGRETRYDSPSRAITTVEHEDGTIARYICITAAENLLKPEDRIIAGQPVAVFTNKEDETQRLGIHIFCLNKEIKHITIIPKFYTKDGLMELEFKKEYYAASTPEIIAKELSKKEKRKLGLK